jgi:hypothetical protein
MNIFMRAGFCLGCLSAVACGTGAEDEDGFTHEEAAYPGEIPISGPSSNAGNAQPANIATEEILAEITAGEETITFLRLGEGVDATLMMRTRGSIENGSVLQELLEREGALSFLEIFQGLAPDRDVPEALVESHPIEAGAMNRSDARVRSVDKMLPPPGVNVCDDSLFYVTPLIWTNVTRGGALSGGDAYICVSNTGSGNGQLGGGQPSATTCTFATPLRRMAGLCNRGTANMSSFAGFGSATTWSTNASVSVPSGEYLVWGTPASATAQRLAAVGISSSGNGASYGLRAGTGQ